MKTAVARGGRYKVKPEAEQLDGRHFEFRAGWGIEPGEKDDKYPGEMAMLFTNIEDSREIGWLASGDIVFDEESEDD